MRPLSPDLDRQIDRLAAAWIDYLREWRVDAMPGQHGVCRACLAYAADLQLDELPHDALHPLAVGIELLLGEHVQAGDEAPLGDLAIAEVVRRRAMRRILARHAEVTAIVAMHIEPQILRLADELMEETCGL